MQVKQVVSYTENNVFPVHETRSNQQEPTRNALMPSPRMPKQAAATMSYISPNM